MVFEGAVGVQCIWADIYTGQTNIGDLDFELACILYNIGALHAELGATDQRQTAEEMKVSCTHFQCAAWAFQELLEDGRLHRSGDMSADLLSFFVQVTLAQAQECILEKSMLDSRKASIVAKVAAQVVAFYRSALSLLTQGAMNTGAGERSSLVEVVGSKLFKEWKKFVDFKLAYYGSLAHLYMGNLAEEGQKMGERVAWYESADARLKEAAKLAKQLDNAHPVEVTEATTFVGDVIAAKLGNAKKENDFIYHEKVPPVESLTEITGAPLVKGIPFSITDPEIAGVDIFARLVPIEAHETASLYSARKDEILRSIRVEIENRNADLAAYLSSLQLERDRLRAPKEDAIPDELIDICAELSLTPGAVAEVERTLTRLDSIAEQTERAIEEAKAALAEEEAREEEDGGGGRMPAGHRRPPSLILVELRKELAKHEETHQKAVESNRSLWENFDQHKDDITVMTSSSAAKIASILPSLKTLPVDEATIAEMERLFDKVEEMRSQRESLEERLLKEMDAADGQVLKLVLATPKSEIEAVFERELRKYDQTVELLRANMAAQENILRALTAANARYAETRKAIIEVGRSRRTRIASLMYTFQVFKELMTNSRRGLEFYEKFQGVVTRLCARIAGVSKVQQEERAQYAASAKKSAAAAAAASMMTNSIPPGEIGVPSSSAAYIPSLPQTTFPVMPPLPSAGPLKLKDYLPYMTNQQSKMGGGGGSAMPATPPPPQIPPVPIAPGAQQFSGGYVSQVSQQIPPPPAAAVNSYGVPPAPTPPAQAFQPPPATPTPPSSSSSAAAFPTLPPQSFQPSTSYYGATMPSANSSGAPFPTPPSASLQAQYVPAGPVPQSPYMPVSSGHSATFSSSIPPPKPPHLVPAAAVSSSLAYATPSSIPPAAAVYQQPHQVPPTSSGPAYGVPTSYGMMNNNFSSPAANVGGGVQQTWQSPSPQHHLPPAPAQSQSPYMQQPPTSGVHHLQQPQQQQQQQQPPHLAQPQYGLHPQPTQQPYYYGSGSNSSAYPSQPQQQPQGMMTSIGNPTSVYQQQQQPSVAAIPSSLSAQVAGLSLGSQNSHSMQPPTSPYVSATYNGLPTVVNGGGGGGAPVGAYMQQQTQLPQPQQQQQQYITPQVQPQAQLPPPAQSAAASVVQALEMESKKGWPVMMPTSVAGAENNKTNTSSTLPSSAVPAAAVSGVSNGHAASAAAAAAATSSVPSVNGGASSEGGAGSASKDIVDGGGEPKDLLSQFDPLFS